jgi:hypothetical protein
MEKLKMNGEIDGAIECSQLCQRLYLHDDDDDHDGDFYSVTLVFRQATGKKADGGQ